MFVRVSVGAHFSAFSQSLKCLLELSIPVHRLIEEMEIIFDAIKSL